MLQGTFKSNKDITYNVQIDCGMDYVIGSDDGKIYFSDEPITITQDIEDTFA
jgi:hypothetical protein